MTGVAVVAFAEEVILDHDGRNDAELLAPVIDQALQDSGIPAAEIGIIGSAGAEFLNGVVGGIMGAFEALPGWPPRTHSHLEGDGAFALYECWARLLAGEARAALVCAFTRPSALEKRDVLALQADPYLIGPLGPSAVHLAALQARAMLETGRYSEQDFAAVVSARRGDVGVDAVLSLPYVASPLRQPDCSTVCSGAAAAVLATGDLARASVRRPAWISAIEHRIEPHYPGSRDLSRSPSVTAMAAAMGISGSALDVLEIHAPFSHQELLIRDAIAPQNIESLSPSGGALPRDPIMATGLVRIGMAASTVLKGGAQRVAAHATNGPCLQHNLLCLMESAG